MGAPRTGAVFFLFGFRLHLKLLTDVTEARKPTPYKVGKRGREGKGGRERK
jgi:hypothetical protein